MYTAFAGGDAIVGADAAPLVTANHYISGREPHREIEFFFSSDARYVSGQFPIQPFYDHQVSRLVLLTNLVLRYRKNDVRVTLILDRYLTDWSSLH